MTLFKQLALVISFISIVILSSVMYINYTSARKDMIKNLYQTTVNNITTLADNLSAAADDTALLTTTIDVAFDSGYYKKIRFVSNNNAFVYEQVDHDVIENVPAWFINLTDIHLKSVHSDITSGWRTIGEVEVIGDTTVIYQVLYTMFVQLLTLFIILSVLSYIILSILLHFVLKPLKDIQKQAEAIMKNEFVIQKKEPYTTEFKNVVKGMNSMVLKVEEIFNKANEAAQRNRELLYNDPVTKLYNRRYLMLKLPDFIKLENSINGGTLLFIAFSSIEIINKLIGKQNTDILLQTFSKHIQVLTSHYDERILARVNQTEFTLVLCNCEAEEAKDIAREINTLFDNLLLENKINNPQLTMSLGLYRYRPDITLGELLTRTDNALVKAKADEKDNIYLYQESENKNSMGKEQWRSILDDAIKHNYFKLKFWSMLDYKHSTVKHKIMTFTIDDNQKKKYLYGDFIAPAISLGLVRKIYIVALKNLLTLEQNELTNSLCCVRLPNEFLKDQEAFKELSSLLEKEIRSIKFTLSFEVSDSFASNNIRLLKAFVNMFYSYNITFGLNSFTGDSTDFSYLKELNPKFIKADVSFLLDQSKESMSALYVITDSLGIEIIANFVKTQGELEALAKIQIYQVQGPITDSIEIIES